MPGVKYTTNAIACESPIPMQAAHASRRAPTRNNTAGFFAPYTTGKCAGVSNEGATPITHFHSIHRPAAAIASKSKKASRAAASIRIRGTDAKPILKAIVAQVVEERRRDLDESDISEHPMHGERAEDGKQHLRGSPVADLKRQQVAVGEQCPKGRGGAGEARHFGGLARRAT